MSYYTPPPHTWHGDQQRSMAKKSDAELRYLIKDCQETVRLQQDFNPKCGEYMDMIHYAAMELRKRKN